MSSKELATISPAPANLKAYYRFESGALTTDSSGNSHTLTAIGTPTETTGKFGGGVNLVASSSQAYSAVNHADFRPTGNFTVGGWIKSATKTANEMIFQSNTINPNRAGIALYGINLTTGVAILQSGKNTGTVAGTDYVSLNGTSDLSDNLWHFVVGVWDGSYVRIYVDGVEENNAAWANAPAYIAANNVRVGCQCNVSTNSAFFNGSLDDVFLLNGTALSAEEVKGIYLGWKKMNGVSNTAVKTINGVAIGSIKTFNGI